MKRLGRLGWATMLTALFLIPTACPRVVYITPESTMRNLRGQLNKREGTPVWPLLSDATRKQLKRSAFLARFHEFSSSTEGKKLSTRQISRSGFRSRLRLTTRDVPLVLTSNGWRINGQILDYFPQDTPRAALETFILAIRSKKAGVLYNLMPRKFRSHWNVKSLRKLLSGSKTRPRLMQLVKTLEQNRAARIVRTGDRATMPYGNHRVRFVLEGKRWMILDPD